MKNTIKQWGWQIGLLGIGIIVVVGLFFILSPLSGPSAESRLAMSAAAELGRLSPEEQRALQEQGFVVKPAGYSSFAELYQQLAAEGQPILVTTDAMLHTADVLLKYVIMDIEVNELRPALLELTQRLARAAQEQWAQAASDELKEAALRNWAYFTVAQHLLGLGDAAPIPEPIAAWVNGELTLIQAHEGPARSPLFGYMEVYSTYDVQGSPPALQGYLQAMSWYERMMFRLRPGGTEEALAQGRRETLQALLITQALKQDPQALERWQTVYATTALFTGEADNLTAEDYLQLIDRIYGPGVSVEALADESKLEAFIKAAMELKRPRSIPPWLAIRGVQKGWEEVAPGFSLLGWRFSSDDHVFQRLSYPYVGTSSRPRELPRGLDLIAALGSSTAEELLHQAGAFLYPGYEEQLGRLREELSSLNGEGLWERWLAGLCPLLEAPEGPGALEAMGHDPWLRKMLNTSLAAWTLNRREALEFGEVHSMLGSQSPTSGGTGGYVEPYPDFYAGLASMIHEFQSELETTLSIEILPPLPERLSELEALLLRLEEIAHKELTGESLGTDDYQLIENIGYTLEELTEVPSALAEALGIPEGLQLSLPSVRAAYTDYQGEQVLEAALGKVFVIETLVDEAQPVYGGVLSYYELRQPLEERLTDESWQEVLSHGGVPLPWWTEVEVYVMQPSKDVPFETIEQGTISGVARALETVVKDEASWSALWKEHASIFDPPPPQPQIDFAKEMVIAVFAGEQPTGGYTATIIAVEELEGGLKVHYTVEVPGPECVVEQLFTQPFHMVRLARKEGVVIFAPDYKVIHCQ